MSTTYQGPDCLSCKHKDLVFVFGSNKAGRHGAGAALHAQREHGAVYGVGEGFCGNSYAIPTLGKQLDSMDLWDVAAGVERFIIFAEDHQELKFFVTKLGTGLAGIPESDMIPMFANAPLNVILPEGWRWKP